MVVMKGTTIACICVAIVTLFTIEVQSKGIVVCYYRYWGQYAKNPEARFTPDKINTSLCSVVNYAFFRIDLETHKLTAKQRKYEKTLEQLVALKVERPTLKIIISVGEFIRILLINKLRKKDLITTVHVFF